VPSLRERQRLLQLAILAEEHLVPPLSRAEFPRLALYRHAYRARLAEALRTNFPVLARVMGDAAFGRMANDYARARPSRRYSIRWHGDGLAAFLGDGPLADLARMEWALGTAFDAPDAQAIDAHFMARVPVEAWAEMPVALHPSARLVAMEWSVESQWQSIRDDPGAQTAAPRREGHVLLAWRKGLEAHWRIASIEEGRALRALHAGGSLLHACEAMADSAEAARVGEWFAGWVAQGMLSVCAPPSR